jgi:hypothetical protein
MAARWRSRREPVGVRAAAVLAALLGVALLAAGCTAGSGPPGPAPGPDPPPGPRPGAVTLLDLGLPRAVHRATALPDGSVLLTGGCSTAGCEGVADAAASELVGPEGTAVAGPAMTQGRVSHTATPLPDGRVLVAGGYPGEGQPPTASMEVYDPATRTFSAAGELREARADHTATVLADGRVLVVGGRGASGQALAGAEIVDVAAGTTTGTATGPVTSTVTATAPLPEPRTAHTATARGGCVLLVGGTGAGSGSAGSEAALRTTVSWCPETGRFRPGPTLLRARVKQAVAPLPGGGVWVVGGAPSTQSRSRFSDTELLLAGTDRFVPGPDLPSGRYKIADAVAALADGRVVVAGGRRLVVLDPRALRLHVLGGQAADLGATRSFQTVTALAGGRVLVAGGYDDAIVPTASAWLVDVPTRQAPRADALPAAAAP